MDIAFEHEIRQRAYAIWVASGMNEGEAEAHWLHAERAVHTEAEAAAISTAPKGKAKPAKAVASKTAAVKGAVAKVAKTGTVKTNVAKTKATATTRTNAAPRRLEAASVEAVA